MEMQIRQLRQQISELRAEMEMQDAQVELWRHRALELEQISHHALGEAERWKKLASETADRLWEIGQSVGAEEFQAKEPLPEPKVAATSKK
jgi:TolA-binding protein